MSKRYANLIKYGAAILAGGVMAAVYLVGNDFLSQTLLHKYRLLSDAFFLPGILMVLFGLLIMLTNEGSLDGVSFVLGKAFLWLLPGGHLHRGESYADYVERRRGKRIKGYSFLFWVGIAFLLTGIVFMLLFNQLHG